MFEPPSEEESPSLITCHLTLANFPLAFEDLKQRQPQYPELIDIKNKLIRGDKIDNYVLSRGTLYWRSHNQCSQRLVVPKAARAMIFSYFHDSPLIDWYAAGVTP
jgi:hypothetical protein